MSEGAWVPQVYLVIAVAQLRKLAEGVIEPAHVVGVRSNLPRRYIDVTIVDTHDETDERGIYTGGEIDFNPSRDPYEGAAKCPFEVYDAYEEPDEEDAEPPGPGKEQEWQAAYIEGDTYCHCLVLGTPDITRAIGRVREAHPGARILSIGEVHLDEHDDHPMGYLDSYKEILVVGGGPIPPAQADKRGRQGGGRAQ